MFFFPLILRKLFSYCDSKYSTTNIVDGAKLWWTHNISLLITLIYFFWKDSSSVHMECIYPQGLGEGSCHRVKWLGKCSVPCQERRNSRHKCVWLLKPMICHVFMFFLKDFSCLLIPVQILLHWIVFYLMVYVCD